MKAVALTVKLPVQPSGSMDASFLQRAKSCKRPGDLLWCLRMDRRNDVAGNARGSGSQDYDDRRRHQGREADGRYKGRPEATERMRASPVCSRKVALFCGMPSLVKCRRSCP